MVSLYLVVVLVVGAVSAILIRGELGNSVTPEAGPESVNATGLPVSLPETSVPEPELREEKSAAAAADPTPEALLPEPAEPSPQAEPVVIENPVFTDSEVSENLRHMIQELFYLPDWFNPDGNTFTATTAAYVLNDIKTPYTVENASDDMSNIYCTLATESGSVPVHFYFDVGDSTICEMTIGELVFYSDITNIQFSCG